MRGGGSQPESVGGHPTLTRGDISAPPPAQSGESDLADGCSPGQLPRCSSPLPRPESCPLSCSSSSQVFHQLRWLNHQPGGSPSSDPEFLPWAATCSWEAPLTHCELTPLSPNSPPPMFPMSGIHPPSTLNNYQYLENHVSSLSLLL